MAFERGTLSFQAARTAGRLPPDTLERFAARAAPPLEQAGPQKMLGWVTGRHLLDNHIHEGAVVIARYYRLTLRETVKRIPPALLRAECRMEEMAAMAATDRDTLSARERRTIRESVEERLLPGMPPQLHGIPLLCPRAGGDVFTGTLSSGRMDRLCAFFQSTTGLALVPLTPERLALEDYHLDVREWPGASFSPDLGQDHGQSVPGREFLTWLWYASERPEEVRESLPERIRAVLIEGPLQFIREGDGAHEITVRKGNPVGSAEARLALLAGKQLRRAKITLALASADTYSFQWDADSGGFSQLVFPDIHERLDARSLFEERIRMVETFWEVFRDLYASYLRQRADRGAWAASLGAIHRWVREHAALR